MEKTDTIVALSSPPGAGERAIVRLSGPEALAAGDAVFSSPEGIFLKTLETYSYLDGKITLGPGAAVPVCAYVMKSPRSYTREDIVEFHLSGSPPLVDWILETMQHRGIRMAAPGEFTQRAFLNGRIDLTQAEAVSRIISARNEGEHRRAMGLLAGGLRKDIAAVRDRLVAALGLVEVSVDFSDQDIEIASKGELLKAVQKVSTSVDALLSRSAERDVLDGESVVVAVLGPPNAGKSSLFNRLVAGGRAIVTSQPGTTRDTVGGVLEEGGIPFRIVDSAGIRPPVDAIEKQALEHTDQVRRGADIQLWVIDGSLPLTRETVAAFSGRPRGESVLVLNKADLGCQVEGRALREAFGEIRPVTVSALTGEGIGRLRRILREIVLEGEAGKATSPYTMNRRHRGVLIGVRKCLDRAVEGMDQELSNEFIAVDLREALEGLKTITGEAFFDDMLEMIFSRFCIGK